MLFDDVFSALDKVTQFRVFNALCGPRGLLRRRAATIVLTCHDGRHS